MSAIRRILCPVDLSPASERALACAAAVAAWHDAAIDALLVWSTVPTDWLEPNTTGIAGEPIGDEALRARLDSFLAPVAKRGITVRSIVAGGDPAAEILRRSRAHPFDWIVMGTHGRHGIERLVLGSVAETVLRRSTLPVLTVRDAVTVLPKAAPPFRRLLCPIDFSPPSLHAFERALVLADELGAALTALHVLDPDRESVNDDAARVRLRQIVSAEARGHFRVVEVVSCGHVADKILRLSSEDGTDLIVMGVHGRGALDVALFGSTTQQIVRGASCPVLTVSGAPRDVRRPGSREGATLVRP
jgi:nucleotide-binding universal stress UspA family protein